MYYYIDGYNLIFSAISSKESLRSLRKKVTLYLQEKFLECSLFGLLVFDGTHRQDEESGLSYFSPLEVAYAPRNQSADAYIIEKLSLLKNRKSAVVVTNDNGLTRLAKSLGAKTLSNKSFLHFLEKKTPKKKRREVKESKQNIDRLSKIFEERLGQLDDFD